MFIICPKCSAKYKIPEGVTLENGQKLKCSACDFVFEKGEEKPLVLEQAPVLETPAATPVLQETAADSLPEAFKPVETSRKGLWLLPIYIIIILALCWAGWTFRDSLKPSFKTTFSNMYSEKETETVSEKALKNIVPKPVVPAKVSVKSLDEPQQKKQAEPAADNPKQQKIEKIEEKAEAIKTNIPVKEEIQPAVWEEVKKPEDIDDFKTEKVVNAIDDLALDERFEPVNPITTVEPEPDVIPLFDIVADDVPSKAETDLSVENLSFRIETNEEGLEQVLVEGDLKNTGLEAQNVPPFTILLKNKEGEVLNHKKIHLSVNQLEVGQSAPFYTSVVPASREIDHIDIQF